MSDGAHGASVAVARAPARSEGGYGAGGAVFVKVTALTSTPSEKVSPSSVPSTSLTFPTGLRQPAHVALLTVQAEVADVPSSVIFTIVGVPSARRIGNGPSGSEHVPAVSPVTRRLGDAVDEDGEAEGRHAERVERARRHLLADLDEALLDAVGDGHERLAGGRRTAP